MQYHPDDGTKWCPCCGEEKSPTQFGRNRTKADGLSVYCRTCKAAKERGWRRQRTEAA